MDKLKNIGKKIISPSKKGLFYCALVLYVLVGIFLCVLFLTKDEVRPTFAYTWTAMFVLFVLYMLYGYARILLLALSDKKKEEKLVAAFVKDKPFRSIYTRAGGVVAGFFFVGWNLYQALSYDIMFYWILAEFYWFVSIIKLYMDYIADRDEGEKKDVAYLIINVCLIFVSGVVVAITAFVIYFDAIFVKSWLTVFPIAIFTVYKVASSVYALIKARKTHSFYDWTFAQTTFSCALFSAYTLVIALMIMYTPESDATYKEFANSGFGIAGAIFIFGVIGLAFVSRRIDLIRKKEEAE